MILDQLFLFISYIIIFSMASLSIGFILLLFIYPTFFWISMLIDCINRDFNDKLLWVLIILFGNLLGAILYYFCVKNKITK